MLPVILRVIQCISDFQKPCAPRKAGLTVKDTSRSLCYDCYPVLCGHCLPSCQAEDQAPVLLVPDSSHYLQFSSYFLFILVNMGSYGRENFKKVHLQFSRWCNATAVLCPVCMPSKILLDFFFFLFLFSIILGRFILAENISFFVYFLKVGRYGGIHNSFPYHGPQL